MVHQVFICYSSHDTTVADSVCATLESKNVQCWIAPRDVLPGALWGESVADAIDRSRIVVLVLSSNSCSSPQVIREVERAASNDTPIIPLRIDDVSVSRAIGFFVSSRHWLDAQTPPLEKHLHKLADTVQSLLSKDHLTQNSIELPEMDEKPAPNRGATIQVSEGAQLVLHCPGCGIKLRPNAVFCHKCGCLISESVNKKEAEERARKEAEERARKEAEERAEKEAEERARKEAEERAEKEAEERDRKEAGTVQQVLRCPECGIELIPNAIFCHKCGTRVIKIEKEEKTVTSVGATVEPADITRQVLRCPECDTELRPGTRFCNKCGARVTKIDKEEKTTTSVGATVEPADITRQILRCPECDTELRPGARFCNKCGARVNSNEQSK